MKSEEQIHKDRNWIATIVTFAMLFVAGLFVFRVLFYVDAINTGKIDTFDTSSFGDFSTSATLLSSELPNGEFDVVTSDDPSLGREGAVVTIVEFVDFACPYCQEVSSEMRELAQKYPNDLYYVFRDFPVTELHPIAQKAAEAGQCAHDQGRFWDYHDKLFQNQDDLDEEELYLLAEQINLDIVAFRSCLDLGMNAQEVLDDYEDGIEAGVRGTPTFFINGNRVPGSIPGDVLDLIVESIVAGEKL